MEGDLTLQVLMDAALSGHLKGLDIRPFERESMLKLNMTLKWYYTAKLKEQTSVLLLSRLAAQISMAVANRPKYSEAVESVREVRDRYNHYLFFGSKKQDRDRVDTSWQTALAHFWEECYGMSIVEANQKGL